MNLTTKEIDGLMRLIGLTKEQEIDCGQCHAVIAEFAEQEPDHKTDARGLHTKSRGSNSDLYRR